MKNTFGNEITLTLFGESHGPEIGAVLDGLAPGIEVSDEYIEKQLLRRRPYGTISTARVEADEFRIVSGVFDGKTTGTPLTILIPNADVRSSDYEAIRFLARPGHADYTSYVKYEGYADYRGGGHASGRLTAALTAAGAILLGALEQKGIRIGTHIRTLGEVSDRVFAEDTDLLNADILALSQRTFPVLDPACADEMKAVIQRTAEEGDSVGGILESAVTGVPAGVGEPWFDTVESMIAHAMFAVPGIKGIEFGDAWEYCTKHGSEFNDAFRMKDDDIVTATNHNGGLNGGISNGMPILFRTAIKPTPTIEKKQETVDFREMENASLTVGGRHDPAIIHRICPVVDSLTALVLADLLTVRFGTDYLRTDV